MDLSDLSALDELVGAVTAATAVAPVGARTQWEVGGPPPTGTSVSAPAGVVRYEPADMTVTVGAGTSFRELDAVLGQHGQECALDPVDGNATIGGILATGLSGRRRLRHGPVRDHLLEVRVVDADGRVVKGGGPTVKNVTGYDLPRLFVGSFGTLGVLGHVTLRCRPRPATARWFRVADGAHPGFRPSAVLSDGTTTCVLLEGAAADVRVQAEGMHECDPPAYLTGAHRGRISVAPGRVAAVGTALAQIAGVRWLAELGVGTVHVACDESADLAAARAIADAHDGWLLREAGGDDIDGYGRPLPNLALMRRIKTAFDPTGKLAPGRLPL